MMKKQMMTGSHISLLLLVVLQLSAPSSAQETPADSVYRTRPENVTAGLGEPAVFRCGVAERSINVTLSYGNYSLTCPGENVEYIPQSLYGTCETHDQEYVAVWTIKGTSYSDNGTIVVCEQPLDSTVLVAVLHVFDNGVSYFVLVGCTIGGFFGILLVFGFLFILLQRSESFQKCFRGREPEEDMVTVVTKEEKVEKPGKKI
ncbi:unnamed protein product [Ophioblennius macclurei]